MEKTRFLAALDSIGAEYSENSPLSLCTSFRIGGPASVAVYPGTTLEAEKIFDALRETGFPYIVIGNGTNLLAPDDGFDGAAVILTKLTGFSGAVNIDGDRTIIKAEAGMPLTLLAKKAQEMSLTGLEFAYGIPGTLGGGVFMNAGAYGGELADVVLESSWISTESGERGVFRGGEHCFGYRKSVYMEGGRIILSASLALRHGDPVEIKNAMSDYMSRRREKQPLEYPSAGSVFKRGDGFITARLIEECGLKGVRIGGAEVSEKHAGFIVNRGGATASDVARLINIIKDTVYEKSGKVIECEIKFIDGGRY